MSRIGERPIPVPSSVTVTVDGQHVRVQGAGAKAIEMDIAPEVSLEIDGGEARVRRVNDSPRARAMHGLTRTLIANMVTGVSDGFTKSLDIQGVGYRAQKDGDALALQLGFSHPVRVEPPANVSFDVEGSRVHVRGMDKQIVGQVAANIRSLRPPEPYKGKGIRYVGEFVRRKAGKAGKGGR